ncbi:MAG TPA: thioredoxin family protein [candidate division Zixibacteria bacterium]|nr:thioredoxin family protein [candidate division Zixibacteria bacterium]
MKKLTGIMVLAVALLVAFSAYVMSGEEKAADPAKQEATAAASETAKETTEKAPAKAEMQGNAEIPAETGATINQAAPQFSLTGADGKKYSLSDFAGKWVVLEWANFDCPFVKKHYGSKNMQSLQKAYTEKGVVWLTICSSAPEKQGNFTGEALMTKIKESGIGSTAYLPDADGRVGKMYGAKTTPHMFVINPKGVLVYAGAIDDKPSTKPEDIEGATNFVKAALESGMKNEVILVASTPSYGCSVKY